MKKMKVKLGFYAKVYIAPPPPPNYPIVFLYLLPFLLLKFIPRIVSQYVGLPSLLSSAFPQWFLLEV